MKLIIAGTRTLDVSVDFIGALLQVFDLSPHEVVSGGARGIDLNGEEWADLAGVPIKVFAADWKKHGRAAGPVRNGEMADYGDRLLLIWNGDSRGSADMRKQMLDREKPVYEVILRRS